jgi:pantoate--beta-alanine ligase
MKVIHTIAEFRAWRASVGVDMLTPFVPTMGALHDGHASLVRQARALAPSGAVVSSIFVNPTQFGPAEDFSKYPRTLESDCDTLTAAGCDAVFVPSAQEMYPGLEVSSTLGLSGGTSVDPGPLANILDGQIRPDHFRGVCTVVAKLLAITQPSHLLLGQKDFQQQLILRHMCDDLNFATQVITCPTLREADGLAMSSRNRYLSPAERPRAMGLFAALTAAKAAFNAGQIHAQTLEALMEEHVTGHGLALQYAVVRDVQTLGSFPLTIDAPAVLLIAAKLGNTRLIDNMLL